VGERAILKCRADYAYGEQGSPPKIPSNATLEFDCELLSFGAKKKAVWEMSKNERLAEATAEKEKGTEAFKAGKFAEASDAYQEAARYLKGLG